MNITEDKLIKVGVQRTPFISCQIYRNAGSANVELLQGNLDDEKKWISVQTQAIDEANPNILFNMNDINVKWIGINIKDSSDVDLDVSINSRT